MRWYLGAWLATCGMLAAAYSRTKPLVVETRLSLFGNLFNNKGKNTDPTPVAVKPVTY